MLAATCTGIAGSSDWFESSFVTYSIDAKQRMLGVPVELIDRHGAVSEPVVRAMAEGVLRHSLADVAVAITGLAGPAGAAADLPVGTVWFAWIARGDPGIATACHHLQGDRMQIRTEAVTVALKGLVNRLYVP
jgi:nicotinamide-nucleotide amidase